MRAFSARPVGATVAGRATVPLASGPIRRAATSQQHELQTAWKNKADGSFHDFDGKTFGGVTFHQQFCMARDNAFPLAGLFEAIDRELRAGRFVIVGLARGSDFHNWVIYDEDLDGEFLAVSKFGPWTIEQRHVRKAITKMHGTDIGTYEVKPSTPGAGGSPGLGSGDPPESVHSETLHL